jgi:hypothetical protein
MKMVAVMMFLINLLLVIRVKEVLLNSRINLKKDLRKWQSSENLNFMPIILLTINYSYLFGKKKEDIDMEMD